MVSGIPVSLLQLVFSDSLTAPCYHLVSDDPPAHVRSLFACQRPAEFERDLDFLLKRYRVVSLNDLHQSARTGRPLPKNSLFLSFDDGYRESIDLIAPVLLRKGAPATFFLTTAFLDNRVLGYRHKASLLVARSEEEGIQRAAAIVREICQKSRVPSVELPPREFFLSRKYPETAILDVCAEELGVSFDDYLAKAQPFLTSDEVRKLLDYGFTVGGHSVDHPLYAGLPLEQQVAQTRDCLAFLIQSFKLRTKAFAFPFVSDGVDRRFYDAMFAEGVADLIFCIGAVPEGREPRVVERFGVETAVRMGIRERLRGEYSRRLTRRLAGHFPHSAPVAQGAQIV
ncbi:MAG TPA: polysaccharide deacetylase family protein [Blastocatellia bacterium]|nr:polysaccharide deacetylase family protein [Blastocatellia bacterium]